MKTCTDCKETKPLDQFQKRAASKDGRTAKCDLCKRVYDNANYSGNKESRQRTIKANTEARRISVKVWLLKYLLTHPCVDCGETDPVVLQFDHQGDKIGNIARMIRDNSLAKVQAEVAKCLVRCANCHTRKTARDFGWWKNASLA